MPTKAWVEREFPSMFRDDEAGAGVQHCSFQADTLQK